MAGSKSCPKCGRKMEEGFTIDSSDYSAPSIPFWHPGAPDKRWYGLKIDKKARRAVQTWRCTSCSYLESYAP
ncbi:PF20097 family protein [Pseudoblastomonas halimionae]|uniref:Uncharacterized protein n=1 Tax=Alteriqipengyuania halimionae TaxID=1926630 RepID=A0A6I4U5X0_9SPHN|nr:PF20097 family protein [Alteriqipengyuania halimionae]MXP09657.1 hypothetical protein [Alteriqipengyuania halimionae]